jgi:photosystem II stability/assembly factor-like uncharacterized protein
MADLERNFIAYLLERRAAWMIGVFLSTLSLFSLTHSTTIDSAPLRPLDEPVPEITDKVDAARLERIIRALSGADSIMVDDTPARIRTRYALSPRKELARRYLVNEIRDAGYEPSIQRFVLTVMTPDLTGMALSKSGDTIWVADVEGQTYMATEADDWSPFVRRGNVGQYVFDLHYDIFGRLWAACRLVGTADGGLFISTDGGANWSLRYSGSNVLTLGAIAFGDSLLGMACGSNGTVIRTVDAGETWSRLDPEIFGREAISDAVATGPMHFWLVTAYGSLYETADFGVHWNKRTLLFGRLAAIDFHGESTGVIVGSRLAFYTKDAGTTWTSVSVPTEFTAVCMRDSLRVIATGTGGEIWVSEDGGANWERFGTECSVTADVWKAAYSGNGRFWLAGRNLVRHISWDASLRSCTAYQFADTIWGENISFLHEGVREPGRRVLLTAHYDAISGTPYECAPGADDNGTGTVAVIECARALRDERTERSVEFVLFDAEELGLKGSRYFVSVLDTGVVYEGDLQLDMIGYEPNEVMTAVIGERVGATRDSILTDAIRAAVDSFGLDLGTEVVTEERLTSDQVSFWDVGIPAVLLIEGRRSELTPHYHSCTDVAANLNLEFFEACTKTSLGAVALLAGLLPPETVPKRIALYQNYPNPFNAGTTVSFALAEAANVELAVYDISGRRVALIERRRREAGVFGRAWDGKDETGRALTSGVYFLRLKAGSAESVRKIVILR